MDMIERLKQATETCEEADRFALLNQNPSRFGEMDQLVVDADNRCRDLVRRHGRELMDFAGYATELDAAKSTAAIAWGWLWHVTTADDRVKAARHLLGQMLDKDLKRYGIQTAKAEGAQVNVQEIEAAMLRGAFGDA